MNKLEKCAKAFHKLEEFLTLESVAEENFKELAKVGVIQAFEYTYEVFWQQFKSLAEIQGMVDVTSPRRAFAFAYANGLIENHDAWVAMLKARNNTSHTYNESLAVEIFIQIR